MNSIRARLLIVMLLIVTLSLGIMGGINYWKTSEILLREVEASMSEKVGDNSAAISAWFAERQAEIRVIARSPVVIAGNEEAILAYLSLLHNSKSVESRQLFGTPLPFPCQ